MRLKLLSLLVLFFTFSSFYTTFSQQVPPINVYTTEDYGAENQNWAITQASNKFIYVANNEGLLEFNGANWQLYPTPNETIMRSVMSFNDKIFTGFYMDFGYWQKNEFGSLEYISIVKSKKIEMLEDEQIWEICELDGWLLFKSLQRIYLFNLQNKDLKIINASNNLTKLSKVDDTIYFQEINKGIFKIENGKSKLISDATILKENRVVDFFLKDDKLLLLTQKKGFYFLENNKLNKWNISVDKLLSEKTIYSAKKLTNGNFVLGSISNGFIYVSKNGDFIYSITQEKGLSNNTVLSLFEDEDNNIWLGLDNGINSINLTSPFKVFVKKNNFWGTIYASILYKDNLYLGTNQGLYYKKHQTNESFKLVENTQGQVWNLQEIDNTLFCSHDSGIFKIDDGKAENLVDNFIGIWGASKIDNKTLLLGAYDGLYVLAKDNLNWKLKNKIEGFSNSSKHFILRDKNVIFVNHEYKGVFKIKVDANFEKAIEVKKDNSVEKGIHSSIVEYNNTILYSSKKGVYTYSKAKDSFQLDATYSKLMPADKFLSAKLMNTTSSNKLWSFTNNDIRYLAPGKLSNKPDLTIIPVKASLYKGASGYENILDLGNENYLIGTSNGFSVISLNEIKKPKDFNISINKVYNYEADNTKKRLSLDKSLEFHNKNNDFEFYYSVPNFNKTASVKYQYQILGLKNKWSVPSKSNSLLIENLPSGNYTFKVRAIIDEELSKNVSEYSFVVSKPWYLSNLMLVCYFLLFILMAYLTNFLHRRYYRKQREKLLETAQKELELQELENSQKIIKLNNDKLRADIENKNRELATSTMSIIKKNEFLNTIKTELKNGGAENINKVVKIIDKNLNNTDDWKLFQEAFNNADKKFLDKVKSKHPELTPNDLRLCAYLRLNLSSKEIAPLLNISPRSVEVKRYRLRKKMNLPHDENLTNYIIEI